MQLMEHMSFFFYWKQSQKLGKWKDEYVNSCISPFKNVNIDNQLQKNKNIVATNT
jgi:hypothetical protein